MKLEARGYAQRVKETRRIYSITNSDWECLTDEIKNVFLNTVDIFEEHVMGPGTWRVTGTKKISIEVHQIKLTDEQVAFLQEEAPNVYGSVIWMALTASGEENHEAA